MPNATLNISSSVTGSNSTGSGNTLATNPVASIINQSLPTGTAAGQVQDILVQSGSVTSGTPVNIDLNAGLAPPVGSAPAATRLVFLRVRNTSTGAGATLRVGNAASNPVSTIFGGTGAFLNVGPNGHADLLNATDGYTITAGTADILALNAASGTVNYEIIMGVR